MRVLPAIHFTPDLALGIADGDAPLGPLHKDNGHQHRRHKGHNDHGHKKAHVPGFNKGHRLNDATRDAHHDAAEDDQRNAVADAPLGDLFAQPHDQHRAGRKGDHGHQPKMPARRQHHGHARRTGHIFQAHGNAQALHQGDEHRHIAGVLGYLAPTGLPFFARHTLDVRADHLQQLHDDAGRNVGHDAQGKDRNVGEPAAGKHVKKTEQRAGHTFKKRRQSRGVDPRHGHMHANAVAAQNQEGPAQLFGQRSLSCRHVCRSYCHVSPAVKTLCGAAPT